MRSIIGWQNDNKWEICEKAISNYHIQTNFSIISNETLRCTVKHLLCWGTNMTANIEMFLLARFVQKWGLEVFSGIFEIALTFFPARKDCSQIWTVQIVPFCYQESWFRIKVRKLVTLRWGIFKFSQISGKGVFGCADSKYQLEISDFGHWRALARKRKNQNINVLRALSLR